MFSPICCETIQTLVEFTTFLYVTKSFPLLCLADFHGSCLLGRIRHNVEILYVCVLGGEGAQKIQKFDFELARWLFPFPLFH